MRNERVEELRSIYRENTKTTVRGLGERFNLKREAVVDALTAPRYGPNLLALREQAGSPDSTALPHHVRRARINRCPACRARKTRPLVPRRFVEAATARLQAALDGVAAMADQRPDALTAGLLARAAWDAAREELKARIVADLYGGPRISRSRGTGAGPPS